MRVCAQLQVMFANKRRSPEPSARANRGPRQREIGEGQQMSTRTGTKARRVTRVARASMVGNRVNAQILRQHDVVQLSGLSRTTIWRRVQDGSIPHPSDSASQGTRGSGLAPDRHLWPDRRSLAYGMRPHRPTTPRPDPSPNRRRTDRTVVGGRRCTVVRLRGRTVS